MVEKAKISKKEESSVSTEDRKKQIQKQLEHAVKQREEYTSLIFKCQGALELLETMDAEKSND